MKALLTLDKDNTQKVYGPCYCATVALEILKVNPEIKKKGYKIIGTIILKE
jgi:hypothetical protein